MDELRNLEAQLARLKAIYPTFPVKAGGIAVRFFRNRFRAQNWVDTRREPWPKRKENPKQRKQDKGRAILIKTGKLRRSIRVVRRGKDFVVIGSDVPYAKIHNEGGWLKGEVNVRSHKRRIFVVRDVQSSSLKTKRTTTRKNQRMQGGMADVRAHTRRMNTYMPRRRFMGPSAILDRQLERELTKDIIHALSIVTREYPSRD